jgi:UDP-N-acetylmuramoyl-tripeptide--D-alanyl-D-alanine ligase
MTIRDLHQKFLQCLQLVSTDTRKITPGSIFFALKGANFNGNTFAQEALKLGAAYCVVDEAQYATNSQCILVSDVLKTLQDLAHFHRNQFNIPVIGITGSNGKTTSKELIGSVLATSYSILVTEGNLNNHIGVPLTLLKLNTSHQLAVVEMGANKPGDIKELCDIAAPNYGVITNIGKAHIEGFGSIDGVIKTKTEMYQFASAHNGQLFINVDDNILLQHLPNLQHFTYGEGGNISGSITQLTPFVQFVWSEKSSGYRSPEISTQLVGAYNLPNFLLAIAIGRHFDIPAEKINLALAHYTPSNNRSQVTKTEKNTLLVDCYNANVSSMEVALKNFAAIPHPRKLAILGDMLELGDISRTEHQHIHDLARSLDIQAWLVGGEFGKIETIFPTYEKVDELIKAMEDNPLTNHLILLKGSRGIQLEKLITCL